LPEEAVLACHVLVDLELACHQGRLLLELVRANVVIMSGQRRIDSNVAYGRIYRTGAKLGSD
jgi:hypothetical protein